MSIKMLYLCEKPSQARDIANVLGCHEKKEGYFQNSHQAVTWCFGHLLEAAEPDYYVENIKPWRIEGLPIVPTAWHMKIKEKCSKQVKIIKSLFKMVETVVIATDADREGEVIARELLDHSQFKGEIKRLWLSALDPSSIQKALEKLRDGNTTVHLYKAGLGRQRADWLIGMNMTMAASVLFGRYGEGVLSVGRVQTPTLKLVVDRDYAIEHFISKEYYELEAQFVTLNGESFTAKWQPAEIFCDDEGYVLVIDKVKIIAEKIKGKLANVKQFEDKRKKQAPPLGLSLSQLQKLCSSRFKFSAKSTLEILQSLYETHKAVTYPRTDCSYLPESQWNDAKLILPMLGKKQPSLESLIAKCDVDFRSPIWNDKKITAHHAVIPTMNEHVSISKMNDNEKKIFGLICRQYIAQFLHDYEYAERKVEVNCEGELFKASSQTPLELGWKRAFNKETEDDKNQKNENGVNNIIPLLTEKETLKETGEICLIKNTKPPAHFTEGTLIEAMKSIGNKVADPNHKKILKETAGIGTEATRAAIIETLFKREYIEKKNNNLNATKKGRKLIGLLPPQAADPILTAQWEQALDEVAEGKVTLDSFIQQQTQLLIQMMEAIKLCKQASNPSSITPVSTIKQICPQCQKELVRRQSAKDKKYFMGCRGYPICRFTAKDNP